MADMGIHALDTARFLLGDPQPVSVYARIGTYYQDFDVDDTGVIMVNWDNGAVSYIESGWWQPHSDGAEAATQLYGRQGFAQLFPTLLELPIPESSGSKRSNRASSSRARNTTRKACTMTRWHTSSRRSTERPFPSRAGRMGW